MYAGDRSQVERQRAAARRSEVERALALAEAELIEATQALKEAQAAARADEQEKARRKLKSFFKRLDALGTEIEEIVREAGPLDAIAHPVHRTLGPWAVLVDDPEANREGALAGWRDYVRRAGLL